MKSRWPAVTELGRLATSGCAAVALLGIMLLMLVDVAGRYLFNAPVPGAGEVIELLMGITVFAALPLVTARGEHVRLDYLERALQKRAAKQAGEKPAHNQPDSRQERRVCVHPRGWVSGINWASLAALADAVVVSLSAAVMLLLAWRLALKAQTVWRYGDSTPFLNIPVAPVAMFISVCAAACAVIFLLQGGQAWWRVLRQMLRGGAA